ncbi:MAG: four helix bundle protein [Phycisphaerae bacterium]
MTQKRTFRDLIVWRKAVALARAVYEHTQQMPKIEQFGLTNQMRRAAVSIASNIAEGNARQTTRDYVHFLMVARGSLAELETQLVIAQELNFITRSDNLTELLREISRMLQALIASLRRQEQRLR